jgi:hypothetical protein
VATGGFSAGLDSLVLVAPLKAGMVGPAAALRVPTGGLSPVHMKPVAGSWQAEGGDAGLTVPVASPPDGIGRVRLRIRLFKPLDPTTMNLAATAYRNRLDRLDGPETGRRENAGHER